MIKKTNKSKQKSNSQISILHELHDQCYQADCKICDTDCEIAKNIELLKSQKQVKKGDL